MLVQKRNMQNERKRGFSDNQWRDSPFLIFSGLWAMNYGVCSVHASDGPKAMYFMFLFPLNIGYHTDIIIFFRLPRLYCGIIVPYFSSFFYHRSTKIVFFTRDNHVLRLSYVNTHKVFYFYIPFCPKSDVV